MSKTLSHRERARRAAQIIVDGAYHPASSVVDSELTEPATRTIARETFPAELVGAARDLLLQWKHGIRDDDLEFEVNELETALALYEEEATNE